MANQTPSTSGECQICGRTQKLNRAGQLVHHGYTRPGWGWQTASCPGTGYRPFPVTDRLERMLPNVIADEETARRLAVELPFVLVEVGHKYVRRMRFPINVEVRDRQGLVRLVAEYQAHADAGDADARRTTLHHAWAHRTAEQVADDSLNGWESYRSRQARRHLERAGQAREWIRWAEERVTLGATLRARATEEVA